MEQNFEHYKVFYHVATEGQISKAAKKLFISQPAVSQSIRVLEKNLGGDLFLRTSKGVSLTSEGKVLYEYVKNAYSFLISGERKFKELKNLEGGEIRIGASDTLCSHYLLPFLEEYNKKNKKVKIHVYNKTTFEIIDLLKNGEVDLGFLNLPITEDKTLEIIEVEQLQDTFICGKKYKDDFLDEVSLSDINDYPLVLLEKKTNMRKFLNQIYLKNNVSYEPEFELGSIDLLVKFAKIGFGLSFVTKNFVKEELDSEEIYEVKIKEDIPKRAIGMAKIKGRPLSNATKEFYQMLV